MAVIREVRLDDAEALIAFKRNESEPNLLSEPGNFNLTVEQEGEFLQRFAESENSIFLVAEMDGCIVGQLGCLGNAHCARLGFAIEGHHKHAYCKNGEFIDGLSMALVL